jgi:hypothetical protein
LRTLGFVTTARQFSFNQINIVCLAQLDSVANYRGKCGFSESFDREDLARAIGDRPSNGLYYDYDTAMRQLNVTMDEQIAVLAVAVKGSFEAAGKYLGIGRSEARKQVQSVEIETGTPLLGMVGKVMVPTEARNLYLLSARKSVRQAWP